MTKKQNQLEENFQAKKSISAKKTIEKTMAILLSIIVWQVVAMIIDEELIFVSPIIVVKKLAELSVHASFWLTIFHSVSRILIGFLSALTIGTLLAIIAGKIQLVETLLYPYIAVIKTTPVVSFIILCLFFLQSANLSIFISFLMVLPVVYTNMLNGIKSTDKNLLEMGDLFKIGIMKKLIYIYLPHLKPYLISACSVALGLAWKAGISAEVIGIPEGSIGELVYEAKAFFSSSDLFAWTAVVIVMSVIFEKVILSIIRYALSLIEDDENNDKNIATE